MNYLMFFSILPFLLLQSAFSLIELNNEEGFITNLISIDSLSYPLQHDSSPTNPFDFVEKSLRRSKNRADYLSLISSSSSNVSLNNIKASDGDFIMKVFIGTPPVEINGIADTTTSLCWTQCAPCDHCFPQMLPLFAPKKSSTFKKIPENSKLCKDLGGRPSILLDSTCRYSQHYVDDSYSHGVLSQDSITIGPSVSQPNFYFGCGFENVGKFKRITSGVIGLALGPGSFISQLNKFVQQKFSYCLVSQAYTSSMLSKMYFGNKALVSGNGVVTTGLDILKSSYGIRLKSIIVDNKKSIAITSNDHNCSPSSKIQWFSSYHRMLVDSGSLLTYLPGRFYEPLENAMKKAIKLEQAGPRSELRLCYKTVGGKIDAPLVTLNFARGSIKLNPENTFLRVSSDVHCLAFAQNGGGMAVLGNLAQRNFLVGFDLKRKTLSFKPADCRRAQAM